MNKFKSEIARVKRHRLEYYESHLTLIEGFIDEKPDISIETCKALIEGLSKLALHMLNQEPLESHKKDDVQPLFKRALKELQKGRGFSDVDLINRLGAVVQYVGELRNQHGDISHGRASLKEQVNDADFADLIIGVTDSLCTYMLRRLDQLTDIELQYEDNPDFNNFLDEGSPLRSGIRFSRALFDQDRTAYEIELGDYKLLDNPEG
jgi:hypothetical protein